jgi:hypothetical protein
MARDMMTDPAPRRPVQGLVSLPKEASYWPVPADWIWTLNHVSRPGRFHHSPTG